jgi:glyoxylase-like metal-dependent hydrolase (beta-lactamase superfamily II)
MAATASIDRVVTTGTFTAGGVARDVENNVWLIGDDEVVLVIDAAHDVAAIQRGVAGRRASVIACTHGHNPHVNIAPQLSEAIGAEVLLHPGDRPLWDETHDVTPPDGDLVGGETLRVAHVEVRILETPGHSPGSVCLYVPALDAVFTGDTLFAGGPRDTGRSLNVFPTLVRSVHEKLLALPPQTRVLPGHGDETTIGAEAPHLEEWRARAR